MPIIIAGIVVTGQCRVAPSFTIAILAMQRALATFNAIPTEANRGEGLSLKTVVTMSIPLNTRAAIIQSKSGLRTNSLKVATAANKNVPTSNVLIANTVKD